MPKSMSEPKNTALAAAARIRYAHVSPAMITATLILSALALLISADSAENRPHD